MKRYMVFRSAKAPQYLCICSARDARHALKIARRMFALERAAVAMLEPSNG